MVVVDTTFLVGYEEEDAGALELWNSFIAEGEPVRVPAACWVEFLGSFSPAKREIAMRALRGATSFEAFGQEEAEVASRLQWDLRRAGRELGWHDLQVAATAIARNELLVTNDRGFENVPGLRTLGH